MASTAPTDAGTSFELESGDQSAGHSRDTASCACVSALVLGMMVATIGLLAGQHYALGDASFTRVFFAPAVNASASRYVPEQLSRLQHATPRMNMFLGIFEPGRLIAQTPQPKPLLPKLVKDRAASYVLQEKLLSMSGEDFGVRDAEGSTVIQIEGGNVNLGGMVIDKLGFKDDAGSKFMSVERRMLAATTCYDIYKEGTCVAKVDRVLFSATPVYKFFYEGDANPFPDFRAEGSFSDRTYTFHTGGMMGDLIARVSRREAAFRDVDTYQVEVAAGVDAAAILAMAVIIDEDHDEQNNGRR